MFIRISLVLAFAVALSMHPQAQASGPISTKHLRATASAAVSRSGDRVSLSVDVVPNAGMHVYAPGAKDYRIVEMNVQPTEAGTVGATQYPAAELYTFVPTNEKVPVYRRQFRLVREVSVPKGRKLAAGTRFSGTLKYQACDDRICYNPVSIPVAWTLSAASGK